jgi:FAD/FMN-containing dehydrogenase
MAGVHPLEELRYLARGWESGEEFPAQEAAAVLAELAGENPASLLQACRRLIEYFPSAGAAWWLSARALSAPEPVEGIWVAADELANDPTSRRVGESLPTDGAVAVPEPSSVVMAALRRRRDVQLQRRTTGAYLCVVAARAAGPVSVLVGRHSATAAAAGARAGNDVWVVVERGALLPGPLWDHLVQRALPVTRMKVLEASEFSAVIGDQGIGPAAEVLSRPSCPPVAELLGWKS